MIKAIFFDLDGVLTTDKTGSVTTSKYVSEKMGLDYDLVFRTKRKYDHILDDGKVTYKDLWPEMCREIGADMDFNLIDESFIATPVDIKMVEFAKSLKSEFKVGIITDNLIERANIIWEHNGWKDVFDDMVVSAAVGSHKNTTKIFEIACERLNVRPDESIFIDNKASNLITCEKLGMKGILFDDEKRDYKKLFEYITGER